ncbi:MAG: hypothetical protein H6659_14810 [Ardenticatenaceae bacterium]|nr:hypothetical protein [Ardenticatenaceae bacterium]MCB8986732.1 hypothetical protein [Ardenticatenaceae bacterium]
MLVANTTIEYNRAAREWEATTGAETLSFPSGEQGKQAAIATAIAVADPELHEALSKMLARYPQLGSRVWRMGMLILAGHVQIAQEDDVIAKVKSYSHPDQIHTVIWSGRNYFCDCEDFHGPHCPRVRWRDQRLCIHVGAVQTLNFLGRWPEDLLPG